MDYRTATVAVTMTPTQTPVTPVASPTKSGLIEAQSLGTDQTNPSPTVYDVRDSVSSGNDSPGIPWYVPLIWQDAWKACTQAPWRFDRTTWILTVEWPREEAEYVADHEGGWDACQFNTQGSGACGWFQELPCQGLEPEVQIAVARSKWSNCGYSFECAWYRWWR